MGSHILGADGVVGESYVPPTPKRTYFKQGAIIEKDAPARSFRYFYNGYPVFESLTPTQRPDPVAGKAVGMVVWVVDHKENLDRVMTNIKKAYEHISSLFPVSVITGFNPRDKKKLDEIMIPFIAQHANKGYVGFVNNDIAHIRWDGFWHDQTMSSIQNYIQREVLYKVGQMDLVLKYVGIGLYGSTDGNSKRGLVRRPTNYFKFLNDENLMMITPTHDSTSYKAEEVAMTYKYLCAYAFSQLVQIHNYTWNDYVALMDAILYEYKEAAEAKRDAHYIANDIYDALVKWLGIGHSEGNSYNMFNEHNFADPDWVKKWLVWNHLFAFMAERTAPLFREMQFRRVQNRNPVKVTADAQLATRGRFRDVGSVNVYLPMARNSVRFNARERVHVDDYLPCIVDDTQAPDTMDGIAKIANFLGRVAPHEPVSFRDLEIRNGEYMIKAEQAPVWYVFRPTEDARLIVAAMPEFTIYELRFPLGRVVEDGLSDEDRSHLWMFGLMTGGQTTLKDAWPTSTSVAEMIAPTMVTPSLSDLGEWVATMPSTGLEVVITPTVGSTGPTNVSIPIPDAQAFAADKGIVKPGPEGGAPTSGPDSSTALKEGKANGDK